MDLHLRAGSRLLSWLREDSNAGTACKHTHKQGLCSSGLQCPFVGAHLPHACRLGSGGFASGYSSKLTRSDDSYAVLKVGGWQVRTCIIQSTQLDMADLDILS